MTRNHVKKRLGLACIYSLLVLPSGCDRGSREAPRKAAPGSVPSTQSREPTRPSVRGRTVLIVSNEGANSITLIDAMTDEPLATLAVGKRPRGVRVSRDGRTLFVALSGSSRGGPGVDEKKLPPPDRRADGVGVVDLANLKLQATLPSGPDPESFDLTSDGRLLFVSNEDSTSVSILDVASRKLTGTVGVGQEPEGLTLSPDGRFAYVACEGDNRVDVLDTSERRRIASIKTKARPRAILFDRDGARAYVTTELGGAVEVMDARRHQLMTTIELRDASSPDRSSLRPMGLVLSPDEKLLYVTTGRAGSIAVIDTAQRKLSRMFTGIGARPWGIALHPDGSKLYTANGPSDDVSVIDPKSGALLKRVPTAKLPWGVALASVP